MAPKVRYAGAGVLLVGAWGGSLMPVLLQWGDKVRYSWCMQPARRGGERGRGTKAWAWRSSDCRKRRVVVQLLCSLDGHIRGYESSRDTMLTASVSSAHGMAASSGRAPEHPAHRLHTGCTQAALGRSGRGDLDARQRFTPTSEALPFAATVASPAVSL
jgi:hypothetical protein